MADRTEVFWSRVDRRADDECWPWRGGKLKDGYGGFYLDGHTIGAHRAAWILTFGEIAQGLLVCHTCDNPPCCNPHHLFLGTDGDNQRDSVAKGRHFFAPRGDENHARQRRLAWLVSPGSWRVCAWCGTRFQVPIPADPKRFCSKSCGAKHRWARR